MCRILLLFTIITLISLGESGHRRRHHSEEIKYDKIKYNSDKNDYKRFKDLAKDVIDADKTARKYCNSYSYMNEITEIYGNEDYKIYVPAKGVNASDVTVKIKHRTVFVRVEKNSKGDVETVLAKFVTLPDIVDEDKSTWAISDERIQITVPYEAEFGKEMPVSCEDDIDKHTKEVQYKEVNSDHERKDELPIVPTGDLNENGV